MTDDDSSQLITFAERVAELAPEAWERIGERCANIDRFSVEGFVGRAELHGRVFTLDADPYRRPFVLSALGAWGTMWGAAMETLHLLHVRSPHIAAGGPVPKPQGEALSRLVAIAETHRSRHPGAATACYVIGLALLHPRTGSASMAALYAPFEPEIPFDSLRPGPEQHAA